MIWVGETINTIHVDLDESANRAVVMTLYMTLSCWAMSSQTRVFRRRLPERGSFLCSFSLLFFSFLSLVARSYRVDLCIDLPILMKKSAIRSFLTRTRDQTPAVFLAFSGSSSTFCTESEWDRYTRLLLLYR